MARLRFGRGCGGGHLLGSSSELNTHAQWKRALTFLLSKKEVSVGWFWGLGICCWELVRRKFKQKPS